MPDPKKDPFNRTIGIGPLPKTIMSAIQKTLDADKYVRNTQNTIDTPSTDMQLPGHPWQFQKDPIMSNSLQTPYHEIIKQYPGLGSGKVSDITLGPNKTTMDWQADRGKDITQYPSDAAWGLYGWKNHDISMSPAATTSSQFPDSPYQVLAHELMHSRGAPESVTTPFNRNYWADELISRQPTSGIGPSYMASSSNPEKKKK